MIDQPTFAIVIPTRNSERSLDRLLKSIAGQEDVTYKVAVVDQGSTDRTVEIAHAHGCQVTELPKPAFYSPPGRSRNLGAASIPGRILVHLDADMELPSSEFLRRLARLLDPRHQAAIIREVDVATGFWAKCKAIERACYFDTPMEAARAVTRELFLTVGGYDERISSGEDFFTSRMYQRHTKVLRDNGLWIRHYIGQQSLSDLLKKKVAYGRTARIYFDMGGGESVGSGWSIVATSLRAYLRNWRQLRSQPVYYLGIYPLRVMELAAVLTGMLLGDDLGAAQLPRSESRLPNRPGDGAP